MYTANVQCYMSITSQLLKSEELKGTFGQRGMILAGGKCGGVSSTTVSITRGMYVVVCFLRI